VHLTVMETNFGLTRAIFTEKHEKAQALEGEISLVKSKQAKIVDMIEDGNGDAALLKERFKKHQADLVRLENEYKALGVNTGDHEDSVDLFSDYSALVHGRTDHKGKSAADIAELRRKLKMAFVRVLKRVEFLNAEKDKWQPTLKLTYVNDRVASVDVTPFLPERTQAQLANGKYHRSDLGKKKPSTKKRSRAKRR
jgi:membrane-bound lytic murein transglycosylase